MMRLWFFCVVAIAGCGSPGVPAASEAAARLGRSRELSHQVNRVDATAIPHVEPMRFPENWPDISDRRNRAAN